MMGQQWRGSSASLTEGQMELMSGPSKLALLDLVVVALMEECSVVRVGICDGHSDCRRNSTEGFRQPL